LPIVVAQKVLACFYFESAQPRPDWTESRVRHLDKLRQAVGAAITHIPNWEECGAGARHHPPANEKRAN